VRSPHLHAALAVGDAGPIPVTPVESSLSSRDPSHIAQEMCPLPCTLLSGSRSPDRRLTDGYPGHSIRAICLLVASAACHGSAALWSYGRVGFSGYREAHDRGYGF
jgi:hypothetical protein